MAQEHSGSEAQIRHIAKLARLQLSDTEIATYARQIAAVLDHMAVLKQQTRGASNTGKQIPGQRLGSDEPGAMLSVHTLTSMAPARDGPFVSVPKVLGDGGGA